MMKINTKVINTKTGHKGRIVSALGDGSEYAVKYNTVGIWWTSANELREAKHQPELPLNTAPASTDFPEPDPGF